MTQICYKQIYKSLKEINRQINHDLSLLCHWLQAKKINLNASKTEIIIFQPKNKQIIKHLNFRIRGQKINTCRYVKYLGVTLEENLDWDLHLNLLNLKQNKAIGLFYKIALTKKYTMFKPSKTKIL